MKSEQLRKQLISDIRKLDVGDRLPTERELCGRFDVSRPTLRKVIDEIGKLGYLRRVPDTGVVVERTSVTGTHKICLIYGSDIKIGTDPIYGAILHQIEAEVTDRGGIFMASVISQDRRSPSAVVEADGVIVMGHMELDLLPEGKPMVVIAEGGYNLPQASYVLFDDYFGGLMVGRYLTELGHRHVAFAGAPDRYLSARQRYRGLCDAFSDVGVDNVALINTRMNDQGGREAARQIIGSSITAVACANDWLALGLISELKINGINVPGDVSVIGYDDISASSFIDPPLTTVRLPVEDAASIAVKELLTSIAAEDRVTPKRILLPVETIQRQSCAAVYDASNYQGEE